MRVVSAQAVVTLEPEAALRLWTDTGRWATFVEGFARVVEEDESWPEEGSKLVWESNPHGRGRVTEKVVERGPDSFATQVFEDRLIGTQTAHVSDGIFTLTLEYELTSTAPLRAVADVIFIRRALRDSLRRTAHRFGIEAEEEAGLRGPSR